MLKTRKLQNSEKYDQLVFSLCFMRKGNGVNNQGLVNLDPRIKYRKQCVCQKGTLLFWIA